MTRRARVRQLLVLALINALASHEGFAQTKRTDLFETEPAGTAHFNQLVRHFEVGDFIEDGYLDVLVVHAKNIGIHLIPGEADGGLGEPRLIRPMTSHFSPGGLAVGDLNGDGHTDFVSGGGGGVMAFLGDGRGNFEQHYSHKLGKLGPLQADGAMLGDLNGDGYDDLIGVGSPKQTGVSVVLSKGDGSFDAPRLYASDRNPPVMALGDVNGDGHLDVFAADSYHTLVFVGTGDGSLVASKGVPRISNTGRDLSQSMRISPWAGLTLVDADADQVIDEVYLAMGATPKTLYGIEARPDGDHFEPQLRSYLGPVSARIAAADLDGDGITDVVSSITEHDESAGTTGIEIEIAWGKPGGSYTGFSERYLQRPASHVKLVDMDSDGKLDIVLTHKHPVPGYERVGSSTFGTVAVIRGRTTPGPQVTTRAKPKPVRTASPTAAKPAAKAEPKKAPPPKPAPLPRWETVGFWNYDGVDGMLIPQGLVLIDAPGSGNGGAWDRELRLAKHGELRKRKRSLWPVRLNRSEHKVCIPFPYPSYDAKIIDSGDETNGKYAFATCEGR